jgi:hypothetical protein
MSGSFTGNTLGIVFLSINPTNGGVQSGSLQSLVGSNPFPAACGIIYIASGTAARENFRLRFAVTTNRNSTCQG